MSDAALTLLEDAIVYIYREAKLARSCEEHEDFAITLKLLTLLRDGSAGPALFDLACGYAVGLPHATYLYRRAARAAFMRQELFRATPDYDYSTEIVPDDDPTDGRRRYYGNGFRNLAGEALDSYRREPPKRVSSAAQRVLVERKRDVAAYFGA